MVTDLMWASKSPRRAFPQENGTCQSLLMADIGEALAGMYFPKPTIKVLAGKQTASQEDARRENRQ